VVFFCTLSLRLTHQPWWRGLDLIIWLREACNSAHVCLVIFIPRSLHQRCACRVWLWHTHATCWRLIVPLFSERHTQCEWQYLVRDTAGTFWRHVVPVEDDCQFKLGSFYLHYKCVKVYSSPLCIQYMQHCQDFDTLGQFMCDLLVCVAKSWLLCPICPAPATFHMHSLAEK